MLNKQEQHALKTRLIERKESLERKTESKRNSRIDLSQRDAVSELSAYDNHPADMGTELFEREKDVALSVHEEGELQRINQALEAIEVGSYGVCEVCGNPIPYERLEAVPETLFCVKHAPNNNQSEKRPVEEDVLNPPVKNSFERTYDGRIQDHHDSFQDAAQYGTSETPSDMMKDTKDYNKLYKDQRDDKGFAEDIESFVGNDIQDGKRHVYPNDVQAEYEQALDEEQVESPLGDIPWHKSDGYVKKAKK